MKYLLSLTSVFICATFILGQPKVPTIRSNTPLVSIQDGEVLRRQAWLLDPESKPDIYEVGIMNGKPHRVTFITDVESISFLVEEGKSYDFIIQHGEALCYTRIVGVKFVPAAVFSDDYQKTHRGHISIEVPEVYELVNVAIAMTPIGLEDPNLVYKNSDYYLRMRAWFEPFKDHPLLARLSADLRKAPDRYFTLKMNGCAFEFDGQGRIVQSKVYDRTGFRGETSNSLRPYLKDLQSFSDATKFRDFYRQNTQTYNEQIKFYREEANIAEMKRWLDQNFRGSNSYDSFKIIFSPLVAYNQSTTWFSSNGFRELQPHINFPYLNDRYRNYGEMSEAAQNVFRSNIAFTEINHGYINPEADKYAERILNATSNRGHWVDTSKGPGYYAGLAAFDEYMNWALVSLRIVDYTPRSEQDRLIADIDQMMVARRGFLQFAAFDKFLVGLYRNRPKGTTIADLYPQIIAWFERNN